MSKKNEEERAATPDRPVWHLNADEGIITRSTGDSEPLELIAKYDVKSGVVEMQEGRGKQRLAVVNFMKGKGHHYTGMGKIGLVEKVAEDAPPKPLKGFKFGEKSPKRVQWMAKYQPQQFVAMWGVIKLQVRTGFRKVECIGVKKDTGDRYLYDKDEPVYEDTTGLDFSIPSLLSGEQRLIAESKTCLTCKAVDSADSGEYDESIDRDDDEDSI